jgi:urea transport system ATP-binding protein
MTTVALPPEEIIVPVDTAAGPVLAVKDVRVSYGESFVVNGASVTVQPGEVSCLMGRNGAGKTTLMKAIMGILPIRGGSVSASGQDVRRWPSYRRARAGIGYVPQGRGIFGFLSVMENILVGLEPVGGKDTGQLDEVFTLFPVLKEMANRQAGLLSGGQQQQLAIARALVGRPKILLLDEPTEGIQPSIVDEIQKVVASFRGTLSVLLIEQFLDFAMAVGDRCFVMEQGRVVLEGKPSELNLDQVRQYLSV